MSLACREKSMTFLGNVIHFRPPVILFPQKDNDFFTFLIFFFRIVYKIGQKYPAKRHH